MVFVPPYVSIAASSFASHLESQCSAAVLAILSNIATIQTSMQCPAMTRAIQILHVTTKRLSVFPHVRRPSFLQHAGQCDDRQESDWIPAFQCVFLQI